MNNHNHNINNNDDTKKHDNTNVTTMVRATSGNYGEVGPDTDDCLPQYPHSLELQRYGGWMNPYYANFGLSGLEAQFPSLTGLTFDWSNERVAHERPRPLPEPHHLDTLFMTERFQHEINDGFKAWQIPSLNLGLEPIEDSSVAVDPQRWHPLFQKARWFDLRSPVDLNNHSLAAPHWSIDNPDVFYELGVCIEMANRMFDQALCTKWLHALFFGTWEVAGTKYMKCNRETDADADRLRPDGDPNAPITQAERIKLYRETVTAADHIVWSFFDGDDPHKFGFPHNADDKFTSGYTNVHKDKTTGEYFVVIRMNARILRTLLQDNNGTSDPTEYLRTVEKHVARAQFAITVCFFLHIVM